MTKISDRQEVSALESGDYIPIVRPSGADWLDRRVTGSGVVGVLGGYGDALLTVDVIATGTTITVNRVSTGAGADDFWVVIDPWTAECEIRKVTAVSDTVLTVDALDYAHAIDDPVLFVVSPIVNVKWFGAKGDGSTDDLAALDLAMAAAQPLSGAAMIVEVPPGIYLVSNTLNIPNKVIVRGAGPMALTGAPGSSIRAKGGFGGTYLIQLGDDASNSVYTRLEDLGVDGKHRAAVGVYSNSINEEAGIIRCSITDCDTYGIHMDNSTTGLCRNYLLRDLYVLNATGGTVGVYIHGGSSPQRGIDGLTVDISNTSTGIALQLDAVQGAVFERIHLEGAVDGIKIGPNMACNACTFIGITGVSELTDLIHIVAGSNLQFIGLFGFNATNVLNDVPNGYTDAGNYIGLYITDDFYSVPLTNYYDDSTVTGFSSMTTSQIYYKKSGNRVDIIFSLSGESDTNSITFTVPYDFAAGSLPNLLHRVMDNGTWQTVPGWLRRSSGRVITIMMNANSGTFTPTGNKGAQGQFFYEAA